MLVLHVSYVKNGLLWASLTPGTVAVLLERFRVFSFWDAVEFVTGPCPASFACALSLFWSCSFVGHLEARRSSTHASDSSVGD